MLPWWPWQSHTGSPLCATAPAASPHGEGASLCPQFLQGEPRNRGRDPAAGGSGCGGSRRSLRRFLWLPSAGGGFALCPKGRGCGRCPLQAGKGRLSCAGSGSSARGVGLFTSPWVRRFIFLRAGVCFLISKALLCSFPNKVLKTLLSPICRSSALPAGPGCGNMRHPAPPSPGDPGDAMWGLGGPRSRDKGVR